MLEPSWTGRRVSVRRTTADDPARTADAVGDLLRLSASAAVIETRSGPVEVPLAAITHAKLVPPSTAEELALQAVAARSLRPAETLQLGGWLLRADRGFTHRANSVLPLRQLGRPLDEALAEASAWYAARGLPLQLQVPLEARRLLDADLGERGWSFELTTSMLIRRLDAPTLGGDAVDLAAEPDEGWLAVYRGGAGLQPTARALLTRHDTVAFASVRRDGRTVAVGRGTVDDGWLNVMAVEVAPESRRTGQARAVLAALEQWGRAHGATRAVLSVAVENTAALALYESCGYWHHHDYHYRTEPTG